MYINDKVIEELGIYYPDVIDGSVKALSEAFSIINDRTGNKFVVIIDEWDVLIRDDAGNQKIQNEYIEFLRSIFKGFEPDRYIALAYMTGILPIKRERTQSAVNNFKEYTMLNPGFFAEYSGFTEEEVRNLCSRYSFDFEEAARWYDGYILGGYHVYNPMSLVNALLDGKVMSYWTETSNYDLVVPLIGMNYDGLREDIIIMLAGGEVPVNPRTFKNDTVSISSKDNVLTYLIHLGYLGYNEENETAFIPNEEIRQEMGYAVESNEWKEMIDLMKESDAVLEATINEDCHSVAEMIERMHDENVSSLEYNDENSLTSVLSLAYLSSRKYYFKPIRELPSGKGFADLVFIPKPRYLSTRPALVVELKWNKDARSALDQIKEKNYPASIREYSDNILLVGINYDKKTKKHECLIEKL